MRTVLLEGELIEMPRGLFVVCLSMFATLTEPGLEKGRVHCVAFRGYFSAVGHHAVPALLPGSPPEQRRVAPIQLRQRRAAHPRSVPAVAGRRNAYRTSNNTRGVLNLPRPTLPGSRRLRAGMVAFLT